MKKHIIGLVVFSFIVGTATIIYSIFSVSEIIPVPQNTERNLPTSCWAMKREIKESSSNSPVVAQAVFNVKTKKLIWKLATSNLHRPTVLHLFLSDEKGMQKIGSFYAENLSGSEMINPSSFAGQMLGKLTRKTNLYIIADSKSADIFTDELHRPVEFDSSKAVSVTIDYGK